MTFTSNAATGVTPIVAAPAHEHHHNGPGISWAAIFGGVFVSMAVSIILVMLGSALELSTVSPWSSSTGTATTFSIKVAIWLIVVQWFSSGMGGYIAGRLRCKWHGLHTHEVFFRDTAHGIVTWAVATVLMVALVASSGAAMIGGGVKAASTVAAGASMGAAQTAGNETSDASGYYIDSLLRSTNPSAATNQQDQRMEVSRILVYGLKNGSIADGDKTYLASIVAERSGLSQADAEKRVDDTLAQINAAKQDALQKADMARKAAMILTLFMVLSMLIGAFVAGASAAFGGSQRDEY